MQDLNQPQEAIAVTVKSPTDYNIHTEVKDVLRLEICKLQQSKEDVVDCITVHQKNLGDSHKHDMPLADVAGLASFALMVILLSLKLVKKLFK